MAKHFKLEIIPAGKWRRCVEQFPGAQKQPAADDRLHAIPLTDMATKLAISEAAKWQRITGLCPGEMLQPDGSWSVGYRFIAIHSDQAEFLSSLDRIVDNYFAAAESDD